MPAAKHPTPKTLEEIAAYTEQARILCNQIRNRMRSLPTEIEIYEAQTLTTELRAILAALRRWAE